MSQTNLLGHVYRCLRETKYADLPAVAQASGVPESTLKKIRSGEVKDPRVSTVQALYTFFLQRDLGRSANVGNSGKTANSPNRLNQTGAV